MTMMHRTRCLSLVLALLLPAVASRAADTPVTKPAAAAAKWCDDVKHAPQQPKTGQAVAVSAGVLATYTDVSLQYQVVEPGAYVERADPEYDKNWTPLPMARGAEAKGRVTYTATLPADLQKHRRLVRYRIAAKGPDGKPVVAPVIPAEAATPISPATPEQQTNHAYYVYDGLPAWKGAVNPRRGQPVTFTPEALGRVEPYHLIGKRQSIENATWREQMGGKEYKYTGTLVVDGVAYDHVRYRARGGVWRYAMGKNMWKIDLPDGQRLKAKDDFGRPYEVSWSKLNLRSLIQLGSYGRRGEQGLYESVGFRLFNLAGVPAPLTHYVHFRIVTDAEEAPADQYKGDFWGLYLAIENEDGRFLKTHGLPDGNLYKMQHGTGELNNHGAGQPADKSDLDAFMTAYHAADKPEAWWRENLDLPRYYSYRAILECIHHYDIAEGKNYDYFRDPKTGKWTVIPWDLDLTWADHMYGNGDEPFRARVLSRPALALEYRNRLREIRDLLFNPEHTGQLIDEYAAIISDPKNPQSSIAEADRRKWDYHPALGIGGQAGHGLYYQATPTNDFAGMAKQMKEYVVTRGRWVDSNLLRDPEIPATPNVVYAGPPSRAADKLKFQVSPYKGKHAFAAIKWRIADVTAPPAAAPGSPRQPRPNEITAAWESEELAKADPLTLPAEVAKPGRTYRVRARMKDATGRWGHWSAPLEFVMPKS
jgi:hypothetical protein